MSFLAMHLMILVQPFNDLIQPFNVFSFPFNDLVQPFNVLSFPFKFFYNRLTFHAIRFWTLPNR